MQDWIHAKFPFVLPRSHNPRYHNQGIKRGGLGDILRRGGEGGGVLFSSLWVVGQSGDPNQRMIQIIMRDIELAFTFLIDDALHGTIQIVMPDDIVSGRSKPYAPVARRI